MGRGVWEKNKKELDVSGIFQLQVLVYLKL